MVHSSRMSMSWRPFANVAVIIYVLAIGAGASYVTIAPSHSTTTSSAVYTPNAYFPKGGGGFDSPGNLLITDQYNNRVIEVDPLTDKIVWSFGSGNGSLCNPGPGSVIGPNDAERLSDGLTLIAGSGIPPGSPVPACADNRVIIVNEAGDIVWQYGHAGLNGSGPNLLNTPVFALQLPNKDIMIVDQGNNRIIEVNYTTRQMDWSYGPQSGPGMLNGPNAAQLLSNGDVLIADQGNNRAIEVNPAGNIVWQYDQGLNITAFASRLPNNDTLIVDAANSRVLEVSTQGNVVWQFFTNRSEGSNAISYPSNAVRLSDGATAISDTGNDRVIVVDNSGQIVYQYGKTNDPGDGPDQLNGPYSAYVIGDYTGQTLPASANTIP
jgi:PQQ-like domain